LKRYIVDISFTLVVDTDDEQKAWSEGNRLAPYIIELAEGMGYNIELQDIGEPEEDVQ
jgi:hypothetical protein